MRRRFVRWGCGVLWASLMLSCAADVQPENPVRIGVLFSTGSFGPHTRGAVHAAHIANSAGGILGRRVEVIVRDSGSRPDSARDAAIDLVENEGVTAIVGPITWPTFFSVYDYCQSRGVPVIGIDAGGWDGWTQDTAAGGAFSPSPSNEWVYRAAARYLSREPVCERIGLLTIPMEGSSAVLLAAFEEEMSDASELVYSDGMLPANIFDAEEFLGPLRDANPDCVVANAGNDAAWAQLVEGWEDIGGNPVSFYSLRTRIEQRVIAELADPTVVNGNFEISRLTNEPDSAEWTWFVEAQVALFGEPPPQPWTSDFFDATVITLLAIEQAGSTDNLEEAILRVANFDGGAPSVEGAYGPSLIPQALSWVRNGRDLDYRGPSGAWDLDRETGRFEQPPIAVTELVDIRTEERRLIHVERP